jgi:cysteine desulfuration protein SufE
VNTDEILEAFELLPEWEARYEFISDLGKGLAPMPQGDKTDQNRVRGCNTPAWLTGHLCAATGILAWRADAEGPLVRGLMVLLLAPFQGKSPAQILATDPRGFFERLGIEQHLSPSRRLGMHALIARVREIANACQRGS